MDFFVENLLEAAKSRSFAPISQNTFTDTGLITLASDEMLLKLVGDLFKVREDFFLTSKTVSLTGGISHYAIPKRAIGLSLKQVLRLDAAGSEFPMSRIDPDERHLYAGDTGDPVKFYFEGDEIVVCPTPSSSSGSLVFQYHAKPNRLVATSSCAKITAVSSLAGTTTFDVNTDLTASLSVGSKVDFLSAEGPFLLWADRVSITAISSSQIQVATADVDDANGTVEPQVNDYICPTGFANIPMLPEEFHPVLAQMMAVRMLAGLGDLQKWQAAKAELKEMRDEAIALVKNRVESSPRRARGNGLVRAFGGG